MISVLNTILLILAGGILIPLGIFCAECLLSVFLGRKKTGGHAGKTQTPAVKATAPQTVVLIPAHNEAAGIQQTLNALRPLLGPNERILVVADNCTDETAPLARQCGVEVCERHDTGRKGKAFALQFGLHYLERDPPAVVLVLDADCRIVQGAPAMLAERCAVTGRPVQALNLAESPLSGRQSDQQAGRLSVVSELGFRFKNLVRPLGCSRLGLPCHLMGTGMALPWSLLRSSSLAGEHLAEDMQLGVELALRGRPALFCPEVRVQSPLAADRSSFLTQRTRWEQGHLLTSLKNVPRLVAGGLLRGRLALLFLAADLLVPPLSLLVFLWGGLFAVAVVAALLVKGVSPLPALLLAGGGTLMTASVLLGWFVFCRQRIPLRSLFSIPFYMLRKLPIYAGFFFGRRQRSWIRTRRTNSAETAPPVSSPSSVSSADVPPQKVSSSALSP